VGKSTQLQACGGCRATQLILPVALLRLRVRFQSQHGHVISGACLTSLVRLNSSEYVGTGVPSSGLRKRWLAASPDELMRLEGK
jgi:hypothetical protein